MARSKKKNPEQLAADLDVVRTRLFNTIDELVTQYTPKAIAERGLSKVTSALNVFQYFSRR